MRWRHRKTCTVPAGGSKVLKMRRRWQQSVCTCKPRPPQWNHNKRTANHCPHLCTLHWRAASSMLNDTMVLLYMITEWLD